MRSWLDLCWLVLPLGLAACVVEAEPVGPDDVSDPPTSLAERACPDDSDLVYESFGAPFMITWCNGCHAASLPEGERAQAPMGIDFDTVEDVRKHADRIWARSADHNLTMPPAGGPDEVEREMLGDWLACGAPRESDYYP